jgi:hypothetical protein
MTPTPDAIKIIHDKKLESQELTQSQKNKFILALDSTQIDAYKTCPTLWNQSHNLSLQLITPWLFNRPMTMGTLGHAYLENFYRSRAQGTNPMQAITNALRINYLDLGDDVARLDPKDVKTVNSRTRDYYHFYHTMGGGNDFTVSNPDHVEIGFSELLYEDSERIYILEGRIDLLASIMGQDIIVDHKYQGGTNDLYQKRIQFRNYAMVAKMNTLVVNYVRLQAIAVTENTFKRDWINFTSQEHVFWRQRLIEIYHELANTLMFDNSQFDKNESACEGKHRQGPCEFTQLCEERDAGQFEIKKSSLYQIKKEWRPW